MVKKPNPNMITLPTGDIHEEEVVDEVTREIIDDGVSDELGLLAMEMAIIKENIENYPDIQTIEDIFDAMLVPHNKQTDSTFAEVVREILDYDEEEDDNTEISKDKLKELFVEIPTKGLYAKMDARDEDYQFVYQIAFLKSSHYTPGESDGMKMIPFLGKKVSGKDFEGNGLSAPWLVTCKAIQAHENIDELKKFLILTGNTVPFVCGEFLYSVTAGILGQHGGLTAENVEALRKGV